MGFDGGFSLGVWSRWFWRRRSFIAISLFFDASEACAESARRRLWFLVLFLMHYKSICHPCCNSTSPSTACDRIFSVISPTAGSKIWLRCSYLHYTHLLFAEYLILPFVILNTCSIYTYSGTRAPSRLSDTQSLYSHQKMAASTANLYRFDVFAGEKTRP